MFTFDHFYRYAELTSALQAAAKKYPHLVTLESLGKSFEGRDIWVLSVTHSATGAACDKPAFWVDGNIHSIEVSASAAVLYFLQTLCQGYGNDADITRVLDTRAFYLCPRINPDGAEWALADKPRYVRSSTRTYPRAYPELEVVQEGFNVEDVDGDGKILRMRIKDSNGHWKCHADDARVMVRRDPAESGGQYYRIIPEGRFAVPEHFDGTRIQVNAPAQGLDLNRNFPQAWRQECEQFGAGDYPTSEPEVKAVVDWFIQHPNITGGVAFHTFSGVLLRPFGNQADAKMTPEDLWTYKKIGSKGTELTGYPSISVYEEFRYKPDEVITGTFDWIYEHLGLYNWVVELWSPMREAGIEKYDYIDWFREHPEIDDLKLMQWNDSALDGKAFVPWRQFIHPELGKVEIGGWDSFSFISNVPVNLLENELEKFPKWLIWQALISPRLEIRAATATWIADDVWQVRLEVQNTGWLPTIVSQQAKKHKVTGTLKAEITLPHDATIVSATASGNQASFSALPRVDLGQLEGWNQKGASGWFWADHAPTAHIAVAEWMVRAQPNSVLGITAYHPKAGRVKVALKLDASLNPNEGL